MDTLGEKWETLEILADSAWGGSGAGPMRFLEEIDWMHEKMGPSGR